MTDITKTVSHLIESQFPAYYRENGAELVSFIKAYYEFLETTDKYSVHMSKQMFDLIDVDESLEAFMSHFQNAYLADFPTIITSNKRFAIKHILDLYKSKGSKNSLELLMKLLYNEEIDVYYPDADILKPSDSMWMRPQYIEVTKSARTKTFINTQITGSNSGAKAFVESVITKRVDGRLIDVLYLSSLEGQFEYQEKITNDGILYGAPTIVGSLTTIDITLGGQNNKIGDILNVVSPQAKHGKVRVTEVQDFTGKVNFNIVNGGYGYTSAFMPGTSDFVANTTKVYVSTALLNLDNTANSYIMYEPVLQRIEQVYLYNDNGVNSNTSAVGRYLVAKNDSGTQVANGFIISVANTDGDGEIIAAASSNTLVTVQLIGDTTYGDQKKITLSSAKSFALKEYVDEESDIVLTVASNTGFTNGSAVYQEVRDTVIGSNTISYRVVGSVSSSNSTTITLNQAWGTFVAGRTLFVNGATNINTAVTAVSTTTLGARGLVTGVVGANVDVRVVYGTFTNGKKIRGDKTKLIGTISSTADTGASTVYLSGNNSANASVGAPAGKDNVTKLYANGIIVGQNTTAIGIYGNTNPFYYSNTGVYYIETNRELLISPPRYANGSIIEINAPILGIRTGAGADFKVGFLENTETVALNTDLISDTNSANVAFLDICIDGSNSGIGSVASITIVSGGTGYTNGAALTFTGGGLADGDPWVSAAAYINTNSSGVITSVTFTNNGEGYYKAPTLGLPSGSSASLTLNMEFGYGFPKSPISGYDALIGDVLTSQNFKIGSIGTITRINPGSNYNASPFVRVYNPYIASYGRGDFYLDLTDLSGSFTVGENIEQETGGAKGTVISHDVINNRLRVHRTSFNVAFAPSIKITGAVSGATANIISVSADITSPVLGDNANMSANVIVANGVATAVEVIDSGYGYLQNGDITLVPESTNNPYIMTGTTNILNQGIGTGFWATTTSHLNSEKKLHDNKYYQEYSYEIISGISMNKYKNIVKKILHVAGTEMFGAVEKRSTANLSISAANSSITTS